VIISIRRLLVAVATWSGSLDAQLTRPWQVGLGAGGTTGKPLQSGAAVIGEIGRSVYAAPRVTFDLRVTVAHIRTARRLCFADQCDLRELPNVAGIGLAAAAGLLPSENTPYVAGTIGAWTGRATYRRPDQSSSQTGALLVAEAGYRVKRSSSDSASINSMAAFAAQFVWRRSQFARVSSRPHILVKRS